VSVLVDTPIWSLLFRRKRHASSEVDRLKDLVRKGQAQIIGPIRQEVLSGIRTSDQFTRVRDGLRAFPDVPLEAAHFERAAEFHNICRARGVQGSNTDFLICAVADQGAMQIFTMDKDFTLFAAYLPVNLLS
jgi:predicted nucleic acid-binding protein